MAQRLFSVIIPSYRRPLRLAQCLQGLAALATPRDRFEVIVVDDGGDRPLEDVVAPWRGQLNLNLFRQAHAGPAQARNFGASKARGDVLVFLDDDCQPAGSWLAAFDEHFRDPDCAVGGRLVNVLSDNPLAVASQLLIDHLYDYYNREADHARFLISTNLAVERSRFCAMGGFDTRFPRPGAEDRDFCLRWLRQGYRLAYAPDMQVYHQHDLNLRGFWRQHFNYGQGAFTFRQLPGSVEPRISRLEPLSFYMGLLTMPARRQRGPRVPLLITLMFIMQLANTAGFFYSRLRARGKAAS